MPFLSSLFISQDVGRIDKYSLEWLALLLGKAFRTVCEQGVLLDQRYIRHHCLDSLPIST